jgi:hypothetical protein
LFPSSQFSPSDTVIILSPQNISNLQEDISFSVFIHFHLLSILHVLEHPSLTVEFPLSHCSPVYGWKILSPQLHVQTEGLLFSSVMGISVAHMKNGYILQIEEQPSPLSIFLSSQVYPTSGVVSPSPQ